MPSEKSLKLIALDQKVPQVGWSNGGSFGPAVSQISVCNWRANKFESASNCRGVLLRKRGGLAKTKPDIPNALNMSQR